MSEPMDAYFSVFNCHVNDAHERAIQTLEAENPKGAAEMRDWKKRGIMGIFNEDLTPTTWRYVELVMEYVNEDRKDR